MTEHTFSISKAVLCVGKEVDQTTTTVVSRKKKEETKNVLKLLSLMFAQAVDTRWLRIIIVKP
jgi:hypothetical protein